MVANAIYYNCKECDSSKPRKSNSERLKCMRDGWHPNARLGYESDGVHIGTYPEYHAPIGCPLYRGIRW